MTSEPRVLVLSEMIDPQLAMLRDVPHAIARNVDAVAEAGRGAQAILHWAGKKELLQAALRACPGVRWVHSRWAGLDNLLFPELVERPVVLTNSKGVFSQSLGEFALAAILYFAKDFPRMLRNQRAERWEPFDVEEIAGQKVGIVGYGDIGRAVARRAQAMGMHVLALKRHPPDTPDPLVQRFYQPETMAEMLARSDYVVIAAPLTPETRHMIGDAQFGAMQPRAVVINVGRGPVIDQTAMVRALREGRIRGAGLDVFEHEPLPPGDPLWQMPNVLVSPHTADHTRDWVDAAMRFFLREYERFRKGEPLENIVNKQLGY
jgi:phosphoglycerate dehydrogenase-like enzyme